MGFSQVQANLRNGRRCSASKAYIRPIRNKLNLHVAKESRVTRILIDPGTKRAYGVEFVKNRVRRRIKATKEVVLSAGSINSPQLLMLSGVGPREHLEKIGVDVLRDSKVGYNLQDHPSFSGLVFTVNRPVTMSDSRVENVFDIFDYVVNGKGPYTIPGGSEGMAFVKTKYDRDPYDGYPDMEIVMGAGGLNGDTHGSIRRLLGIPDEFYETVYKDIKNMNAFTLVPVLLRTRSRGRVTLQSRNPFRWPAIHPNMYRDARDLKTLIEGVKMVSERCVKIRCCTA